MDLGFLMGVWVEGGQGVALGKGVGCRGLHVNRVARAQAGAVGVSGHTCLVNSEPV